MHAVDDKRLEAETLISILLKAGARVGAPEGDSKTPLHHASERSGNPEVIAMLLEAGSDGNARRRGGKTPLIYAAEAKNSPGVIFTLIGAGADVNARDEEGRTALMFAAEESTDPYKDDENTTLIAEIDRSPEMVSALLESGADAKIKDNAGLMAIDYAEKNPGLRDTEALQKLREASY
jgi:ankyrin repeat protein